MTRRKIEDDPKFVEDGDHKYSPPEIPLASAIESLNHKAKIIRELRDETLAEPPEQKISSKPWFGLRSSSTTKLSLLFQEMLSQEGFTAFNQVIKAYLRNNKYNKSLITPTDYNEVIENNIKPALETEAKKNTELMLDDIDKSFRKKYSFDPAYQEFLFLVAEAILQVISSLNFLAYHYSLTAEYFAVEDQKKQYNEKFKKSLSTYKRRIDSAQEDKTSESELDTLTMKLSALQSYFPLLQNKKNAFLELLKDSDKKPQEIKARWQEYITNERSVLPKLTPLEKIENEMTVEFKTGEIIRTQIASSISQIQSAAKDKITAGDNKQNAIDDINFSDRASTLSFETYRSMENKHAEIKASLATIKKKLPKTSFGKMYVTREWLTFYSELDKSLIALADFYDLYYELYPTFCPSDFKEFEASSYPALRIKHYEETYQNLLKDFEKYLVELNEEIKKLKLIRQNPPPKIKEVIELIAELESKIVELEQSFTKHLDELGSSTRTTSSLPSSHSFISLISDSSNVGLPSTISLSPITELPPRNPVIIGIPVDHIQEPSLPPPVPLEPPSSCWCCLFNWGNSPSPEKQPLLRKEPATERISINRNPWDIGINPHRF